MNRFESLKLEIFCSWLFIRTMST